MINLPKMAKDLRVHGCTLPVTHIRAIRTYCATAIDPHPRNLRDCYIWHRQTKEAPCQGKA